MHIIVVGNEKGGSGKTTTSMHIATALMSVGCTVSGMDLDIRQRSFTRYMENRLAFSQRHHLAINHPKYIRFTPSELSLKEDAAATDEATMEECITRASQDEFLIIDCPGSDTVASRYAHSRADTIITPINDSFVDLDLIGVVDPDSFQVLRPSFYAEMVFKHGRTGRA